MEAREAQASLQDLGPHVLSLVAAKLGTAQDLCQLAGASAALRAVVAQDCEAAWQALAQRLFSEATQGKAAGQSWRQFVRDRHVEQQQCAKARLTEIRAATPRLTKLLSLAKALCSPQQKERDLAEDAWLGYGSGVAPLSWVESSIAVAGH